MLYKKWTILWAQQCAHTRSLGLAQVGAVAGCTDGRRYQQWLVKWRRVRL